MSDFLNRQSVLILNSLWQIIGTSSPKNALVALHSSYDGSNVAAKVIDVQYEVNLDGTLNLENAISIVPLTFEDWTKVKIRDGIDSVIRTARLSLRCPTVIVTTFSKMPMKKSKPNKSLLYLMQDGRCGYTNEKIGMKAGNLEHKCPKSKGGPSTFGNLMFVKKEINSKRGNRPLEELGLRPLFYHSQPKPFPVSFSVKDLKHNDWRFFVN